MFLKKKDHHDLSCLTNKYLGHTKLIYDIIVLVMALIISPWIGISYVERIDGNNQ
jgi:hypothetical protein